MTGKDGKPFKTRDGSVVGLDYLLDEAVDRAYQVVCNPERLQKANLQMSESEQRHIAETVGLGAIKYADLSHNRTSDYVFDVEQMVQLEGNTAAYIQYSYARISSILSKGEVTPSPEWIRSAQLQVSEPAERDLALALVQFEDAVWSCTDGYFPSQLTAYLTLSRSSSPASTTSAMSCEPKASKSATAASYSATPPPAPSNSPEPTGDWRCRKNVIFGVL